jgi:hypothetical protein
VGIEILRSLHLQAEKVQARFEAHFAQFLSLDASPPAVALFDGSFLDFDWADGDVVFANSTCFDDELMADMSKQAEKLKPGAIVVTFTKVLWLFPPSPHPPPLNLLTSYCKGSDRS